MRPDLRIAILLGACLLAGVAPGAARAGRDSGLSAGDDTERRPFIVLLADPPLATYRGGLGALAATSPEALPASPGHARRRLNPKSAASVAYLAHLDASHARLRTDAHRALGRPLDVEHDLRVALNGVIARLSAADAAKLARVDGVRSVQPSVEAPLDTDRGPLFVGAPALWDGSVTPAGAAQGEGIVIGIIDSGINGDHPAFATVGGDGYAHENPLGTGNYLGECFEDDTLVCTEKLIGRYNFTANNAYGPAASSEDEDGHGTHVASTAAGNWYYDAPIFDIEGYPTGYTIGPLHGVAPHANLIAYRACNPDCASADVVIAIEQAIIDGVDVLNKSISSPAGNPWGDALALASLSARAAGISFAISAGNDGPDVGSVAEVNAAPWNASVAALTHDREFPLKGLVDLEGGDTPAPAGILGRSLTLGHSGPIVYAGDYANGDVNPEQCINSFPPGTWTQGEIVLCDRGTGGRLQKCIKVRDGGAGGCILANADDELTSIDADAHVIPAIHVDRASGDALKAWLASGSGHRGTIEPTGQPVGNAALGDRMADFSSRGPYTGFDWLAPSLAAPGVAIYAAYRAPKEVGFLDGTSMASPHVAGAMALLRQVRPSWTDAEILSALMSTATRAVVKEDGVTPADPHDYGAGRIQVAQAVNAGLLLDETAERFALSDPHAGGDPRILNVASLVDDECLLECRWQRTVTATVADTWTATATGSFSLAIEPSSFSLAPGESQVLTITASTAGVPADVYQFAEVVLSPASALTPPAVLSVAVVPVTSNFADVVSIGARRDAGSLLLKDLLTIGITELQVTTYGLTKGETRVLSITGETGEFDPYEQPDGVGVTFLDVPEGVLRVIARTFDSEAPDVDLFLGRDDDLDGEIEPEEELCSSGGAASQEYCEIATPLAGRYWIALINYKASWPGATDDTHLQLVAVTADGGEGFAVDAPQGAVPALQPFDMRLYWDLEEPALGDTYYGNVVLGSDVGRSDDIGNLPVTLVRNSDDVVVSVEPSRVESGGFLYYSIDVSSNFTNEDLQYEIVAPFPPGFTVERIDMSGGTLSLVGNDVNWSVLQESPLGAGGPIRGPASLDFRVIVGFGTPDGTVTLPVVNDVDLPGTVRLTDSFPVYVVALEDTDGDGSADIYDTCTLVPNLVQVDSDSDGYGNECDGDFDQSGLVDDADLDLLRAGFFTTSPYPWDCGPIDMNCDSAVNALDLALFKTGYGKPPGPSGLVP